VDRWHTTNRRKEPSQAWFETHVWPLVDAAYKKANRAGFLPNGGGSSAYATPIERPELVALMTAWVDAELAWGLLADALRDGGEA
jgi:hypothetical protein